MNNLDYLVAAIVSRTRNHPEIVRGASVRGTIAFKEVLYGFTEIFDKIPLSKIETCLIQAALITLAPRIHTKQGDYESAEDVIRDIVEEVLEEVRRRIQASKSEGEAALPENIDWLSSEEIGNELQNLSQLSQEAGLESAEKGQVTIIPDADFPQGGKEEQSLSIEKTIEHLMKKLEDKLSQGEISEDEYQREKNRLEGILEEAAQAQSRMPGKELSETMMELMDVQDKQWQKEINFEQMYIYYHIKSTSGEKELSPTKRDYYGLKILIDDLKEEGILKETPWGEGVTLTGQALNKLLEYLTAMAVKGKELQDRTNLGRTQPLERTHDVRKYSQGDVFEDISVRHTLKEIIKQKKRLSDIRRSDIRVFMKQRHKLQSDVVLCVDASGSMGYRYKLAFARLAAAGLAKAALERGDNVGIVTFDNFGKTVMPLTNKKEAVIDFIAGLTAGGSTNIGDGIKCATRLLLHRPSKNQKYITLITDGKPNAILEKVVSKLEPLKGKDSSEEYAIFETMKAASKGIEVSVVHVIDGGNTGDDPGDEFAENVTKAGKGQIRRVSSLDDLSPIMSLN